jgi:Skp family chaperone for outer membrane proteins
MARAVCRALAALILPALVLAGDVAHAQGDRLPVVIVYQDQLIERSLAGQALRAEEEALTERLVEERREIERAFEEEEQALARRRAELDRAAFAKLAADFDARVREARTTQDEKALALQRAIEASRKRFLASIQPVLSEVMARFGASVMMEGRSVVLADPSLDVTGEVIARMDEIHRQRTGEPEEP